MENLKSTCLHYTVIIIHNEYLHKILDNHDVQFQTVSIARYRETREQRQENGYTCTVLRRE